MEFLRWVINEAIVFSAMYIVSFLWWVVVFIPLGFSIQELLPIGKILFLFPLIITCEKFLRIAFPSLGERRVGSIAAYGFCIYVSLAVVYLGYVLETPFAVSNIKDVIFAGLIIGVPSGLLIHYAGNYARENFTV